MYQLVSGTYSLEGIPYTSYGIKCDDLVMEDLSLDRDAVARLVQICNCAALESIHLPDVVDDFLTAPDAVEWAQKTLTQGESTYETHADSSADAGFYPFARNDVCIFSRA